MNKGLIKTQEEIGKIAEGGKILGEILTRTANKAKAGVSTEELDEYVDSEIVKAGGTPSFKGYGSKKNPFPAALCASVNSVVVHGIPSKDVILKNGDILSLDVGMEYKGFYTDTAVTISIGTVSEEAKKITDVTKRCLNNAIRIARPGNTIGDISNAIQKTAEAEGFNVVRDLVGHGVGYGVHEDPAIPCYGKAGSGMKLKEGMVLAIEPMVVAGEYFLEYLPDGWTIATKDGKLSAHFEHTIAITKFGNKILT